MWVLRYEDTSGKVLTKHLKLHSGFEIGRDCDESDGTSIRINHDYVSRKHLTITVEPPSAGVYSSTMSILKITFKTRASTIVNGSKYKLAKGENQFDKEFTDSGINMSFKNQDQTITVKWELVNVYTDDTESELLDAFNSGTDLRISKTPETADLIVSSTLSDSLAATAMIQNIPIRTKDWISYISGDPKGIYDECDFAIDNHSSQTSDLFSSFLFFLPNGDTNLQAILERNGATIDDINIIDSSSDGLRDKIKSQDRRPVIYSDNANKVIETLSSKLDIPVIGNKELFQAMKTKTFSIETRKRIAESVEPVSQESEGIEITPSEDTVASQSQWRRRKRHKKVDNLAFMVPVEVPLSENEVSLEREEKQQNELEDEQVTVDSNSKKQSSQDKSAHQVSESIPKESTSRAGVNSPVEEVNSPVEEGEKASKTSSGHEKRKRITASQFLEIEDLEFNPDEDQKPVKRPKIKIEADINTSLFEAIKESKKATDEKIKEDLGLEENKDIGSQMSNLAIVETVSLPMRKKQVIPENPMYQGRRNVKKFKKNMKLKSAVTRTFVEVKEGSNVQNLTEFERNAFSDHNDDSDASSNTGEILKSSGIDLESTNSQIRIPENDLFVSNETQSQDLDIPSNKPTPRRSQRVSNTNRPQVENSIDDDDDDDMDDMPKFAFTES